MKKSTRIRFKAANYSADHKLIEQTDEVAEGAIVKREGDGFVVRVEGHELPYYVMPDDIIEGNNNE